MNSYLAKPADIERKWYIIDAAGKPLGRTAVKVAALLRGKHKPTFTPNVDCGDHVVVVNCEKTVLTGKKPEQKLYYRHSGYVSGLKAVTAKDMMEKDAGKVMYMAVRGMLPDTTLGREALTRLRTFKGAEHKHTAQKPEVWD